MKKKTYTITMTDDKDVTTLTRQNNGFNVLELLGLVEYIKKDLMRQVRENSEDGIDVVKRQVIDDK